MDNILDTVLDELEEPLKSDTAAENVKDGGSNTNGAVEDVKTNGGEDLNIESLLQALSNGDDIESDQFLNEMQTNLSKLIIESAMERSDEGNGNTDSSHDKISEIIQEISNAGRPTNSDNDLNEMEGERFLDEMMQQLLAKELMYEPMKEIQRKYPTWLEAKKSSLDPIDFERYTSQSKSFDKLIQLYEREPNDMQNIFKVVQEIQDFGQPPPELMNEVAPGFPIHGGEGGSLEDFVSGSSDCPVM